jgi:hypothetical protein
VPLMGVVSISILVSNNEMVGFFFSDFGDLVNESSSDSKTWQNTELASMIQENSRGNLVN